MTVAERANELIVKFLPYTTFRNDGGYDPEVSIDNAKQCAIIHINGIIASKPIEPNPDRFECLSSKIESSISYWEQVKSAIQNL